ncbi:hypothetical protein N658DRAFT_332587 [Parathielavia hyrcaniae]|uniref:Uncharacterized protein n=1 Tax=Parathielavia hyrcaniae TaxID=113614 RepID=A0AAN6SXU1_9PEZI|nr:hypothetical protein N658DRAFT_332587 [Parathielavia hyrcaniae]
MVPRVPRHLGSLQIEQAVEGSPAADQWGPGRPLSGYLHLGPRLPPAAKGGSSGARWGMLWGGVDCGEVEERPRRDQEGRVCAQEDSELLRYFGDCSQGAALEVGVEKGGLFLALGKIDCFWLWGRCIVFGLRKVDCYWRWERWTRVASGVVGNVDCFWRLEENLT